MAITTIRLQREDTLGKVFQLIEHANNRHVLLIVPATGNLLTEAVDMGQALQHAREQGKQLGIVTLNSHVREAATQLRLPVYPTESVAKLHFGHDRPWWLPVKERHQGERTYVSAGDRAAMHNRLSEPPRWWRYSSRYISIAIFILSTAIVLIALAYAVPSARVTLRPSIQPISVTQQIVADPRFDAASASGATVPGRLLVYSDKWRAAVDTSGRQEIPDQPARGIVTFVNRLPQTAVIPAGTRVSTSTGVRIIFQTLETVEIGGSIGAEVDVEAVALKPGPSGNLAASRINRIEGSLAPQLNVRNLFPMSGGSTRIVATASVPDRERLREHVIATLFEQARADMRAQLESAEFLPEDSVRLITIYEETYSHFINEETPQLTLEIRAELHGTAVDEVLALELVSDQLLTAVPDSFEIMDETIQPRIGRVSGVDAQGRVSLEMIGEALTVADLSLQDPLSTITGQETIVAQYWLHDNLPLRDLPEIEVWPAAFDRIPYLPARIFTTIDTDT